MQLWQGKGANFQPSINLSPEPVENVKTHKLFLPCGIHRKWNYENDFEDAKACILILPGDFDVILQAYHQKMQNSFLFFNLFH